MEEKERHNVSWEGIIYALILLVALILRFYELGARPLDADESSFALSSWQMVNGQSPEDWREPLVVGGTSGSLFVFGDNDFTARLIPATLGTALVCLPWLLRGIIGRAEAIATALLLALSPSFVYFARTVSGHIYVAAFSLLLAVCLFGYLRGKRSILLLEIVLVLLLCSGVMGFTTIVVFALSLALMFALGRRAPRLRDAFQAAWAERRSLAGYTLLSMGLFLLISSGFFAHLEGLGLSSLTGWVEAFDLPFEGEPWYWHLQRLVAYEPLITVFGVIGAGYMLYRWRKGEDSDQFSFQLFLVFWAGGALFLIALMGRKEAGQVLSPLLPLALLGGSLAGELVAKVGKQALRQANVVIALVFCLGLIFTVHSGWSLNYRTSAAEWLAPGVTSPDVLEMAKVVDGISESLSVPDARVVVDSSIRQPFAWYLRHHENVDYITEWPREASVIIVPFDEEMAKELSGYTAGFRGGLRLGWSPGPFDLGDFWRWFVYRETWGDERQAQVALYLKK